MFRLLLLLLLPLLGERTTDLRLRLETEKERISKAFLFSRKRGVAKRSIGMNDKAQWAARSVSRAQSSGATRI